MEYSLDAMPEVVLNNIFKRLDFMSILKLRKVSPDLRNFIDFAQPDLHLRDLTIGFDDDKIIVHITHIVNAQYKKNEKGCLVSYRTRRDLIEILIDNEHFMDIFCQDLKILLRLQKSELDEFSVNVDYFMKRWEHDNVNDFLNHIEEILKTSNRKVRTQRLSLTMKNQEEFSKIIPYIEPKTMWLMNRNPVKCLLEMNEIINTSQWKKCQKFETGSFYVAKELLRELNHLKKADVTMRNMSTEDLIVMKEEMMKSSSLRKVKLYFENTDETGLFEPFGHYLQSEVVRGIPQKTWFFRCPVSDKALSIARTRYYRRCAQFSKIKLSSVPSSCLFTE